MLHQRRDAFLVTYRHSHTKVGHDLTLSIASDTSSAAAASTILRRKSASPAFSAVIFRITGTWGDGRARIATMSRAARAASASSALSLPRSALLGAWPESCIWKIR